MSKKELYTKHITKGNRTYFFDIYETVEHKLYFKITESKKVDGGFDKHNIMVFEEDIVDFRNCFVQLIEKFNELHSAQVSEDKKYSFEKNRETYPEAYKSWTDEDDNSLEYYYFQGISIKDIAELFGRNEGAITSRIRKLGLRGNVEIHNQTI
jgi:hypothetical protein